MLEERMWQRVAARESLRESAISDERGRWCCTTAFQVLFIVAYGLLLYFLVGIDKIKSIHGGKPMLINWIGINMGIYVIHMLFGCMAMCCLGAKSSCCWTGLGCLFMGVQLANGFFGMHVWWSEEVKSLRET